MSGAAFGTYRPGRSGERGSEVRASLLEHLSELRARLIRALLAVAAGMALVGGWSERVFRWVMDPVIRSLPEGSRHLN